MNLLNQVWDFFSSVKLAIFTLCSLAVTSIIGTVIPQGEQSTYYIEHYGPGTARFMEILDIPTMYGSWWFLGLLGLLAANLIICSIDRFPRAWQLITRDNLDETPQKLAAKSPKKTWPRAAVHLTEEACLNAFSKSGLNPVTKKLDCGTIFFAQQGRFSRLGVYLVHLSILVIFIGAIVGSLLGFKGSIMVPELATTDQIFAAKDHKPIPLGFSVRCNSFSIDFYDNGMPKEFLSNLSIFEGDREILNQDIEVNKPLTYRGITFYQSSYQPFQDFIVSISDKTSGETKDFTLPFQKQQIWPDSKLRFGIVNAKALGQRVVSVKLWLKYDEQSAVLEWIDDGQFELVTDDGRSFQIVVKQKYATGLQVAKDPGVWIVYLGCALLMLGLYMAFFMSHRRVWLYLPEDSNGEILLVGSTNKNRLGFERYLIKLQTRLESGISG